MKTSFYSLFTVFTKAHIWRGECDYFCCRKLLAAALRIPPSRCMLLARSLSCLRKGLLPLEHSHSRKRTARFDLEGSVTTHISSSFGTKKFGPMTCLQANGSCLLVDLR